ncbi:MAG: hypothetical protein WC250_02860 [Candidatus Paceibacterota bacterium]
MKTLKNIGLTIALIVAIACPAYCIWKLISKSQHLAEKGKVEGHFWLPENSKVFTNYSEWDKASTNGCLFRFGRDTIEFGKFKELDGQYLVYISEYEAVYRNCQGAVMLQASRSYAPEALVVSTSNFKYLGGGKVSWDVSFDKRSTAVAVVGGLLVGVLVDVAIFIGTVISVAIFCGLASCIMNWWDERKERCSATTR